MATAPSHSPDAGKGAKDPKAVRPDQHGRPVLSKWKGSEVNAPKVGGPRVDPHKALDDLFGAGTSVATPGTAPIVPPIIPSKPPQPAPAPLAAAPPVPAKAPRVPKAAAKPAPAPVPAAKPAAAPPPAKPGPDVPFRVAKPAQPVPASAPGFEVPDIVGPMPLQPPAAPSVPPALAVPTALPGGPGSVHLPTLAAKAIQAVRRARPGPPRLRLPRRAAPEPEPILVAEEKPHEAAVRAEMRLFAVELAKINLVIHQSGRSQHGWTTRALRAACYGLTAVFALAFLGGAMVVATPSTPPADALTASLIGGSAFIGYGAGGPPDKVAECHKPGTPAEKVLELPQAAVKGHDGHGDEAGECAGGDPPGNETGPPGNGTGEARMHICHASGSGNHTIEVSVSAIPAHLGHGDSLGPCPDDGGDGDNGGGNDDKVDVCHVSPGGNHTLTLPASAVPAHLAHGDHLGECDDDGGGGDNNTAPLAAFDYSCAALTCSFNGSASSDPDGFIANWTWTINPTLYGPTVGYTFPSNGAYTVTLTVTDNGGATATLSKTVSVHKGGGGGGGGGGGSGPTQASQPAPELPPPPTPPDVGSPGLEDDELRFPGAAAPHHNPEPGFLGWALAVALQATSGRKSHRQGEHHGEDEDQGEEGDEESPPEDSLAE